MYELCFMSGLSSEQWAAWVQAIGSILAIVTAFLIAGHQHRVQLRRERSELTTMKKALFLELAKTAGRCCFDFEDPWGGYLQNPASMGEFRMRKFIPEPPVIYLAVAPRIGQLSDDAAQNIVAFYIARAAWARDLENVADALERGNADSGTVGNLAKRLRQSLEPAQRALESLAPDVAGADEIDRNAMKDADKEFASVHPNAGKTFRERIALALQQFPA
jgi:hypothetical protein